MVRSKPGLKTSCSLNGRDATKDDCWKGRRVISSLILGFCSCVKISAVRQMGGINGREKIYANGDCGTEG